jgi:hypothetical protein
MASRLAEILAGQSLRIQTQRIEAAQIEDADPVPAALTAEAQPVFKTARDLPRADSAYALHASRQIAIMCGHDWDRAQKLLAAMTQNTRNACDIANDAHPYGLDTI